MEDSNGIREETYFDQKMNPIDEEFATFVKIKEVFLNEDGLEKKSIIVKKMDPVLQCWDEEESVAEP